MKSFYQSYVLAFRHIAQDAFDKGSCFQTTSEFELMINNYTLKLLHKAAAQPEINLPKLQSEIEEIGSIYIRKYRAMVRQSKADLEKRYVHKLNRKIA